MATLLERIRAARETWTTVEGFSFLLRRPTQYQFAKIIQHPDASVVLLRHCVIGWKDVKETDLAPGGAEDPAEFDVDVLVEWAQDRPSIFTHLTEAATKLVSEHIERGKALEKN